MIIISGVGVQYPLKINKDNMLLARCVAESHPAHVSHEKGKVFTIVAEDASPGAGEYTLYVQNIDDTSDFIIDAISTNAHDADVRWKLHKVTGTASGTSITAESYNFSKGVPADLTCVGGAGGVAGLTSAAILDNWFNGQANSRETINIKGRLILGRDDALAIEYDAGTGGAVSIVVEGHYHKEE